MKLRKLLTIFCCWKGIYLRDTGDTAKDVEMYAPSTQHPAIVGIIWFSSRFAVSKPKGEISWYLETVNIPVNSMLKEIECLFQTIKKSFSFVWIPTMNWN